MDEDSAERITDGSMNKIALENSKFKMEKIRMDRNTNLMQ